MISATRQISINFLASIFCEITAQKSRSTPGGGILDTTPESAVEERSTPGGGILYLKTKKKEHARRQHPAIIFINFKTVETGNACSYFSKCLYAKLRTFITQRGMNRCQDDQCDEADFLYAKLEPFRTHRGYVRCLR